MTFLSFLTPAFAFMGLLAIPLVVLYLLRQKRPDLQISSTLLWSRALADMRASTPFQKLRRNLLLLLQLLILAVLVFTLMRPVIQAAAGQTQAGVIVIDATASMQTRDGGGGGSEGPTRLDRAKEEARKLVDSMRPGDRFMLIVDSGGLNPGSTTGLSFTSSKADLKAEIDKIKPGDTPSDLSESLILAASSLKGIGSEKVTKTENVVAGKIFLLSDGAGVHLPDTFADSADALQFIKIGSSSHSVGITRLSITPVPKEKNTYQVFVGLKNSWDEDRKIGVVLDYNVLDNHLPGQVQFVTVPANGQGGTVFEKVVADPGKLFVRVDDTDDDFPLDNTAYGVLEPDRKVRVALVTSGNAYYENFIKTAVKIGSIDGQILAPAAYSPAISADLIIFDGFVPPADQLPRADTLIVRPLVTAASNNAPVDVAGFKVAATIEEPAILRWKRDDPVMQFAELSDLRISRALLLEKDPDIIDLMSSPEAPLIAYKDFAGTRRYFVTFSPFLESNWYMLPSQLIFLQNLIDQTRLRHYIGLPQLLATGTAARLYDLAPPDAKAAETKVRIIEPDKTEIDLVAQNGMVEFPATDHVGFYQVSAGNKKSLFAANLLSTTESSITPQSLQIGAGPETRKVQEASSVATVNKEIWQWLALAALAVLSLEWWIYHRRIA